MKKILLFTLSIATIFTFANNPHTDNVRIDAKESSIKWIGSKVTSSHEGNVSVLKGALSINHGTLVGGEIAIDMSSITCTDIESEKKNQYLVDHLNDEDFFNTESFPIAIIQIDKVIKGKGDDYNIAALLTIKGITNPIVFDASFDMVGKSFTANAKIVIDRTKWGIKYGSGSFFENLGDKMILDEISFEVLLKSLK